MKITRSFDLDGTLGPLALNYLAGIPQQYVFFRQQQLRHPASIYSLSLDELSRAFVSVVECYVKDTERLRVQPKDGFELKSLLSAQEHLLHRLQEHLDSCFLILKTLIDPATTKSQSAYAEQYVTESKLPGAKAFIQATADYKVSLRILNKLKHNLGRLRGFGIYVIGGVRLGYFLEEPDGVGALGPSPELHPDRGAFSFARDLKWRFFLVYSLSENLVNAVNRSLMGLHQFRIERTAPLPPPNDEWHRLVTSVSKIERAIFPKEQDRSVATVLLSPNERELSIKFPEHIRIADPALRGHIRAVASTVVDGFSREFKVPFP
jgi:hypothetical protein